MRYNNYFSVKDFVSLPSMEGSRVLCVGDNDMIQSVNVMEIPDIAEWVVPNEMLVTTAYPFRNQPEKLIEVIHMLKEKGACGMAIKPKRFIDTIPQSVVDEAEKNDFSIIELGSNVVFADAIYESMEIIVSENSRDFEPQKLTFDKMLSLVNRGASLKMILNTMRDKIGHHILLINCTLKQLCYSSDENVSQVEQCQIEVLTDKFVNNGIYPITLEGKKTDAYVFDVSTGIANRILFLVLEDNEKISNSDISAYNSLVRILSIKIRHDYEFDELRYSYRNKFIIEWIEGKLKDVKDIIAFANSHGYTLSEKKMYTVGIIKKKGSKEGYSLAQINDVLMNTNNQDITVFYKGKLITILEECDNDASLIEKIRRILPGENISICLSERENIENISAALESALRIYDVAVRCNVNEDIIRENTIGALSILYMIPKSDVLDEYKNRYINPIHEYDRVHDSKLAETLEAYLDTGCNARRTADKIFTHYNTIAYRINKIQEILNIDINNPENQFCMRLAMKLDHID